TKHRLQPSVRQTRRSLGLQLLEAQGQGGGRRRRRNFGGGFGSGFGHSRRIGHRRELENLGLIFGRQRTSGGGVDDQMIGKGRIVDRRRGVRADSGQRRPAEQNDGGHSDNDDPAIHAN